VRRRARGRGGAGKILVQCYDAVAQRTAAARGGRVAPVGYEDVGEAAFGAFGRAVVASSIYIELLGTGALLFILEARARGRPAGRLLACVGAVSVLVTAAAVT
jgi:hypothetical protein